MAQSQVKKEIELGHFSLGDDSNIIIQNDNNNDNEQLQPLDKETDSYVLNHNNIAFILEVI